MASADRLIEVFNEAKARPAGAERDHFLAEACRDELELKEQVLSLLQAHEGAGEFLQSTPLIFSTPSLTEKPGDKIGRYKLLEQIGEGGCGVVYMAEQEEPVRRRVALKIIKLGMDTRSVIARFEAERQALALMDHPNIAKVFDGGATQSGRLYFVMELVRGVRITEFCDEARLPTGARLRLFVQVCQAIQHAHQKGIIHRDLKPSNILVTINDGVPVPKVIDFGIAKATGQRLTDKTLFTQFHSFIGTPAYTSPEQAEMSSVDIDTRSDIYSLGVLLYELLTGRTPFDGDELLRSGLDEMRRTIREKAPTRPSTHLSALGLAEATALSGKRQVNVPGLAGAVRGDLDWIVMKCLEKDRSRRYETATGLAMDVQRHLDSEPVMARSPGGMYLLQKLAQRNKRALIAAGTVLVSLLVAVLTLAISNARIRQERDRKDQALRERGAALEAARGSEHRAREQLFVSLQSQAQARRNSRQMGQRLESLAALAEAARIRPAPELRDNAIAAMALPDVRGGFKWQVWRTNCVALACDAMGQRYALLDYEGVLTVRSMEDNQQIHRFETGRAGTDRYRSLAFSPDGRFLAKVGEGQQPLLWSLDTGEAILQDAPEGASAPTFSANRRFVALAHGNDVCCFDLATGRESNRWRTAGRVHGLQFHPADHRIAVGYKDWPWVSVYDAANGREMAQLEVGISWRTVVSWHPEGRQLAVGSTDLGIQIWDVAARRRVALLEGHAREMDFLTFHPSGSWLACSSWDGVVRVWDPTTGREAMQIPLAANLQFSRDGRWLGFFWPGEDQAQLLEFVPPQEYFTLQDNSGAGRIEQHACAVSPDDRLLAVAMDDGVHLWDLPNFREVALVPSGLTEAVVFESDGQALWTCAEGSGLQRWAMRPSGTNASELLLGPPRRIELPFAPVRISSDGTIRRLAVVSEIAGQAMVLDLDTQSARGVPIRHPMAGYVALSPDAKWLATSGWHSDRVQLWNAESGELVRDWVVGLQTRVAFTPDSRELIVGRGSEFQFLKVETLETSRRLRREIGLYPGDVAFSPEGELMAMEMAPAMIHLKEVSTGRTVAQLEDPFGDRSNMMSFSRDGTKLIVVSTYASAIHVWDLRAIRERLKAMNLDWDWPEFPAPVEHSFSKHPRPMRVQVVETSSSSTNASSANP